MDNADKPIELQLRNGRGVVRDRAEQARKVIDFEAAKAKHTLIWAHHWHRFDIVIKPAVSMSAVKADIEAALKRRAMSDSQAISVEVRDANVTLTGPVHSWSERELARHSAWGTPGVRNVVDNMTVVD